MEVSIALRNLDAAEVYAATVNFIGKRIDTIPYY